MPSPSNQLSFEQLRNATHEVRAQLADHPDVTLVGMGPKVVGGKPTDAHGIVVGVEKKGDGEGPPLPAVLSTSQGEIPTDLITSPMSGRTLSDGVVDGSDLLITVGGTRSGTLGIVLEDASGNWPYAITNSHVVAAPGENRTGEEVWSRVNGEDMLIGTVAYHTMLLPDVINTMDVALIELNQDGAYLARAYEIQPLVPGIVVGSDSLTASRNHGFLRPHMYAPYSEPRGVNDCVRPVETAAIAFRDSTSGRLVTMGRCFRLDVTAGAMRSGHSGSALVRDANGSDDLILVGLIFGGSGSEAFAFSWPDIVRQLRRDGFEFH